MGTAVEQVGGEMESVQIHAPADIMIHLVESETDMVSVSGGPDMSVSIERKRTRMVVRIGDYEMGSVINFGTGGLAQGSGTVSAGAGGIAIGGSVRGGISFGGGRSIVSGIPTPSQKGEATVCIPRGLEVFFTADNPRYDVTGNVTII